MPPEKLRASRPPCAVAVVFAMAVEADAFERLAVDSLHFTAADLSIHEGTIAGRRVAWCVAGAGAAAAARATRLLVDGHRPAAVISAGFAGGLDPALARGSVVLPRRAISIAGEPPHELVAVPSSAGTSAADVAIVSVDRVVTTARAKRQLAEATGAAVVDLETHSIAGVARDRGLPCGSVRVISDDASQDLPPEIATLVEPASGMRRLGAALAAIGRRPRAALDMWQLWEHAVVDGRTLAAAIAAAVAGISDGPPGSARAGSSAGPA